MASKVGPHHPSHSAHPHAQVHPPPPTFWTCPPMASTAHGCPCTPWQALAKGWGVGCQGVGGKGVAWRHTPKPLAHGLVATFPTFPWWFRGHEDITETGFPRAFKRWHRRLEILSPSTLNPGPQAQTWPKHGLAPQSPTHGFGARPPPPAPIFQGLSSGVLAVFRFQVSLGELSQTVVHCGKACVCTYIAKCVANMGARAPN